MEEKLTEFIANRNNDKCGVTFAKELKKNLERRFPNHGLNVFERRAANYLDPHFKGIHLKKFQEIEATKAEIEKLIVDAQKDSEVDDATAEEETNNNRTNNQGNMSPTSKLRMEMEDINPSEKENSTIKKEMDLYEAHEISKKEESVLMWWKAHEKSMPNLAKFARKILAIPSSSAKSERVYSTGGNFVVAKRTRMNSKKVENLIVIKENKKQLKKYLDNLDGTLSTTEEVKAFKKIKVLKRVVVHNVDSEPSSDDEYYFDND